MRELWLDVERTLRGVNVLALVRAVLVLGVGLAVARLAAKRGRWLRLQPQQAMVLRRLVVGVTLAVSIAWAMSELGVDMRPLLGAAGILTVALGFASQTSVSNLISGLFLMLERPFVVGDVIRAGDTEGEVLTIELLSVRIRTSDNLLVRIPNETVLKSNLTNLTRYPVRRLELKLGVPYGTDLARVRDVLLRVAAANPICLAEPKPLFIVRGFGESSIDLSFCVWSTRENFLELTNSTHERILGAFADSGIAVPYPHRTISVAP
jgi:small-conductance mechanosensitive channel